MGKWRGKQTFAKGFQEALWRSRGRDCAQCWQFGDGRVQVRIQYTYIDNPPSKIRPGGTEAQQGYSIA